MAGIAPWVVWIQADEDSMGDNEGLDLLLLSVGIRAEEAAGAASASTVASSVVSVEAQRGVEVALEVDGGGLADLLVDGGLGDEVEDGEGVAGAVGGIGEGGLGLAARGGEGRGTRASPDSTPWGSCRSDEEELRWPFGGPVIA
ncbi:hypothetical protein NL676_015964 [Syzygium grande]|nr:hypothetical protein NL676_015964 [Syzygium grande]